MGVPKVMRGTEYTRSYSGFRGVMLGGGEVSDGRLAYAKNIYRDYDGGGGDLVESIPGYREIAKLPRPIRGLFYHRQGGGEDAIIIHAKDTLYRLKLSDRDTNIPPTALGAVAGEECISFTAGRDMYFIDGVDIHRLSADGSLVKLDRDGHDAYVPTVYINGEPYEDRNLLTPYHKEEYIIEDESAYSFGNAGLKYKILDRALMTAAVVGMDTLYDGDLYIPSSVMIGGMRYRVTEIGKSAISFCTHLTAIYVSHGIEIIHEKAFFYCSSAKEIVLPDTVYEIGHSAFCYCRAMTDLYLGTGVNSIGGTAITSCNDALRIHYGAIPESFTEITGHEQLLGCEMVYLSGKQKYSLELPLHSDIESVISVTENGQPIAFSLGRGEAGERTVIISTEKAIDARGDYVIELILSPYFSSFGTGSGKEKLLGRDVLSGCRVCEEFDGRIFLSGNPALPGTVFYSTPSEGRELYFGALSYFNDGLGVSEVRALLAVGGSLAVFKSENDGGGSIFYHTPKDGESSLLPKIYPVSYAHSGIGAVAGAVSFLDDPVFISRGGLYALDKEKINLERSVVCRSHNINAELLSEDLSRAVLTEWCGYLVLGISGHIYLADSRAIFRHNTGALEYEWFYLEDIGSYENSTRVYRYESIGGEEYRAHKNAGEVAPGVPYSAVTEDGGTVYFVIEDGIKYTVYPTEELRGGDFSPASVFLGIGDLLFFGTGDGSVMLFNNDKRGVPPDYIRDMADFDPEEYEASVGRDIHPSFYSFAGHAPTYAISTPRDSCRIPHLTKSTVKHSLVLKCRAPASGRLCCEVGTERSGYSEIARHPGSEFSFAEWNFESVSLDTGEYYTLPLAEREKNWIEKQITVYSSEFASPIGIFSITYRYTVRGRIKGS